MRYTIVQSRANASAGFTLVHLVVFIAIVALLIAILIPTIHRLQEQANLARCQDNLRQIGSALLLYARTNQGDFPVSATVENPHLDILDCLAARHPALNPGICYCPSEHRPGLSYSQQNFSAGIIGYYYFSASRLSANPSPPMSKFLRGSVSWPRELNTSMDPKGWIMSDIWVSSLPTAHAAYKKGVNYLMLDGSVGFVAESPRQQFR